MGEPCRALEEGRQMLQQPVRWAAIAPEFEWDGSLRDIYVVGTTAHDWQQVLDALRELEPAPSFSIDGAAASLPERADGMFAQRQRSSPLLALDVGGVRLNCHFFDEAEIEFDLDPREVTGAAQFAALEAFMTLLAAKTGKNVILTYENTKSAVILSVAPEG